MFCSATEVSRLKQIADVTYSAEGVLDFVFMDFARRG